MWTTIINSVLKLIEYFAGWMYNKSKDTSLINNENAKKLQERIDENRSIIDNAANGDKDALEELRKRCAKRG